MDDVDELLDAALLLLPAEVVEGLDDELPPPPPVAGVTVIVKAGPDAEAVHPTTKGGVAMSCSLSPGVNV